MKNDTLNIFHPKVAQWFDTQVGTPTDIQNQAWPVIAENKHVLITAPTGSGKTLTAFLWALNKWLTQEWETGKTYVLYISPLKALNADIRRNLIRPLQALEHVFSESQAFFPQIRVMTRSGDTPQSERQSMVRKPPEILITTPESLNLILSSPKSRFMLKNIRTVILDEIHAIYGSKRGTHLITAVDRLVPLCGEFQRIGLSATINPLETVAQFLGGYQFNKASDKVNYIPRDVTILKSNAEKKLEVKIRSLPSTMIETNKQDFWAPLVEVFREIIHQNRSTLFFTIGRRLCEKITLKINMAENHPVAYAHHGSLSKEIRQEVETSLKKGNLKAIVATNTLEMGIDIGQLDEVIHIQSPDSIASAIQKIGRAGHGVGEISRGTFFPTHSQDLLISAVIGKAIGDNEIEPQKAVENPLDILAQIIISMTGTEQWHSDDLYNLIRTSFPYRNLDKKLFELVLEMLAGRYDKTKIRELQPKISWNRIDNTITAKPGALFNLYGAGGSIPDRGHYTLRHEQSRSVIGELDEEFVWEAKLGQNFTLGTQKWKIQNITHNDVFVVPGNPNSISTPFWRAEARIRNACFSEKITAFLEKANAELGSSEFNHFLKDKCLLDDLSAERLIAYLKRQKTDSKCDLPHRWHIVIEEVQTGPGGSPGHHLVIHTFWGSQLNQPFAYILQGAYLEKHGYSLDIFAANDSIVLQLAEGQHVDHFFDLIAVDRLEDYLKQTMEGSGFFGAQFRECAGRALLISRGRMGQRMPLWMTRLRSQKLLQAVHQFKDFPILIEAWRTTLQDEFNLPLLKEKLEAIQTGQIKVSMIRTEHPSPFAQQLSFQQINQYMYESDAAKTVVSSSLSDQLLDSIMKTPEWHVLIAQNIIHEFEQKRQRLANGYSPSSSIELVEWIKERILLSWKEWLHLKEALNRDHSEKSSTMIEQAAGRLALLEVNEARFVCAIENQNVICCLFENPDVLKFFSLKTLEQIETIQTDEDFDKFNTFIEWFSYFGPRSIESINNRLPMGNDRLQSLLDDLVESEQLIKGSLVEELTSEVYCDIQNYEILLRMARKARLPAFKPLPVKFLPAFLGSWQNLTNSYSGRETIETLLNQLSCYFALPEHWEKEILPARLPNYLLTDIENALQKTGLNWIGNADKRIAFCYEEDLDLLTIEDKDEDQSDPFFPDPQARYDFSALIEKTKLTPSELAATLWNRVWQGQVTNDHFATLRKGIQTKYEIPDLKAMLSKQSSNRRRISRRSYGQWQTAIPYTGTWKQIIRKFSSSDKIEQLENRKERVRILLDRYGILFKELLLRESLPFQWRHIFYALRLMEFSGEILSGYFFENIPGPQFISHEAYRKLQSIKNNKNIFWIHAQDPASCCGIPIKALNQNLPNRIENTHLVYHGEDLILVSKKLGKELTINVSADDAIMKAYLNLFHHLLERAFEPMNRLTIETINDEPAPKSPFVSIFKDEFETMVDHKQITLYKPV